MFNHIITERMSFVAAQMSDKEQLFQKACADHLFPEDADVSAIFKPLDVKAMLLAVVQSPFYS